MTGHKGNSEFCFSETLNVPRGKQNSIFPGGPVIKFFVIPPDSKIDKTPKKWLLDAIAYTGWLAAAKTNMSYQKITITVFFFAANKNIDSTKEVCFGFF